MVDMDALGAWESGGTRDCRRWCAVCCAGIGGRGGGVDVIEGLGSEVSDKALRKDGPRFRGFTLGSAV